MEGTLVCTKAGTTGVVVEYNLISPRKIRDQQKTDLLGGKQVIDMIILKQE